MKNIARTMLALAAVVAIAAPAWAAPCTKTKVTVAISDNPIELGDSVDLTATVTTNAGVPVTVGSIEIWYRKLGGAPDWQLLGSGNVHSSTGQFTATFTPVAPAYADGSKVQFEAVYRATGGGGFCDDEHSPRITAKITAEGCGITKAVYLTNNLASGSGQPAPGSGTQNWTFSVNIKNCLGYDLTQVKLQGGTNGWANFGSATASDGTTVRVRNNNRNEVVTWDASVEHGETKHILVTLSGSIPAKAACWDRTGDESPFIRFLSGAWSAAYVDLDPESLTYLQTVKTAITDGEDPTKPNYTDRAYIVVTCPAAP
jgi:hypothetical protein